MELCGSSLNFRRQWNSRSFRQSASIMPCPTVRSIYKQLYTMYIQTDVSVSVSVSFLLCVFALSFWDNQVCVLRLPVLDINLQIKLCSALLRLSRENSPKSKQFLRKIREKENEIRKDQRFQVPTWCTMWKKDLYAFVRCWWRLRWTILLGRGWYEKFVKL